MRLFACALSLAMAVMTGSSVAADPAPVSTAPVSTGPVSTDAVPMGDLSVSPKSATIAAPITARLSIRMAEGERARLPKKPPLPEKAELLDMKVLPPVALEDGSVVQTVEFLFTMYKVGKAEFPAVAYEIVGADGQGRAHATAPTPFEIVSVRTDPNTADQPINIRPPVELPLDLKRYLLPALALLAAAIVGALLWRKLSARRRMMTEEHGPPAVPPHLEAFESLASLKRQEMFSQGHGRRFFFLLSDIMRKYVEGRYGAPALERTTDEFEREFDLRFERKEKRDQLIDLMRTCDMVKFANKEALREDGDQAFDTAWAWVESTRPKEPIIPEEDKGK